MNEQKKRMAPIWWIIIILVIIGLAVVGYFYIQNKNDQEKTDLNNRIQDLTQDKTNLGKSATGTVSSTSSTTSTGATTSTTATWKNYTNSKYGYTLTFTDAWTGYKVGSNNNIYYFGVPTTDTTWSDPVLGDGYASLFAVSVKTIADYDAEAAENQATAGTLLVQTSTSAYTWSPAQAYPADIAAKITNLKASDVMATFALIK
jgi:hypothetical protein